MVIRVNVSQKDIDTYIKGGICPITNCAVASALRRKTGRMWSVGTSKAWLTYEPSTWNKLIELPNGVSDKIMSIGNRDRSVKPFSFRLKVEG